jgi:hypothetical protein
MDPYLEGDMWQEFHERLANQISVQLLPLLRPKYVALLSKRYTIVETAAGEDDTPPPQPQPAERRVLYPDVHVVAAPAAQPGETPGSPPAAVAQPTAELPNLAPEELPLLRVEIRDVAQRRLVTIIEILSPVNKYGSGLLDYLNRRTEVLYTTTHLLELDLLRQGRRIALQGTPPPAPYYIYLSRAERRPYTQVWALSLREPLPTVPVPLLPPDADVPLHLQQAVDDCFALVGYETLLDYTTPPPPPALSAEDAAWVGAVLQAVRG